MVLPKCVFGPKETQIFLKDDQVLLTVDRAVTSYPTKRKHMAAFSSTESWPLCVCFPALGQGQVL